MIKTSNNNFILNNFLKGINKKKLYIQGLKKKIASVKTIKKYFYKEINSLLFYKTNKTTNVIRYVIIFTFSKKNTSLHVMNSLGELKYFCSAGVLSFIKKAKLARKSIIKAMIWVLAMKFRDLHWMPIALHLVNISTSIKRQIKEKIGKMFSKQCIRNFNINCYNGCRRKKVSRKKFKKKK